MINKIEEVKNILAKNLDKIQTKEEISKLVTGKYNLSRIISATDEEVEGYIEKFDNDEEIILSDLGYSWTDLDDENLNVQYDPMNNYDTEIIFNVKGVEGYKVVYIESECKVTDKLYTVLGTGYDCIDEAEVLISKDLQFRVTDVSDGREDVGYVEITLELI